VVDGVGVRVVEETAFFIYRRYDSRNIAEAMLREEAAKQVTVPRNSKL
jgi:hypothetical protein